MCVATHSLTNEVGEVLLLLAAAMILIGSRLFPNLDQFCVNIGGKSYPSTNISAKLSDGTYTGAETFMEVCRIFSQIHSPQFDIVFDVNEYLGTTTLPSMNSFVF